MRQRHYAEGAYFMQKQAKGAGSVRIPKVMVDVIPDDIAFIPEFTDEGILLRAVRPVPPAPKTVAVPAWANGSAAHNNKRSRSNG